MSAPAPDPAPGTTTHTPPRLARALLDKTVRLLDTESIVGDLHEEWLQRRAARGAMNAASWYWIQALVLSVSCLTRRMRPRGHGELRFAARSIRRNPTHAFVIIGGLGLAIAVNLTAFAIADVVLFDPLPFPHAARLAHITNDNTASETGGFGVSYLNMQDVRQRAANIEQLALYMDWQDVTYAGGDEALRLSAAFVGESYFDMLNLRTRIGRLFDEREHMAGSGSLVAVVGAGFWNGPLGRDEDVVGRVFRLNGHPVEIVGVLEDDRGDMRYLWGESPVNIFLPLLAAEQLTPFQLRSDRGARVLNAVARIAEGSTHDQVSAELALVSRELEGMYPQDNRGWTYNTRALHDAMFEGLSQPVRILVAGSLLVLILVVVNLTTLSLIRGVATAREAAVRRALGASEQQIFQLAATTGILASTIAWASGLVVARFMVGAVERTGALSLPSFATLSISFASVAVAFAIALVLGVWFAVVERRGERGAALGLGESQRSESPRSIRIRNGLVTVEVALAFVLLVGAALMMASFRTLRETDYGFDTNALLTARVDVTAEQLEGDYVFNFADALTQRAREIPGVTDAFLWSPNRLGHGNQVDLITRVDRWDLYPSERVEASLHAVHPGTLDRLGIPLLAGRDFGPGDNENAVRVAIVSQSLANSLWPGEDAVGKMLETRDDGQLMPALVIGVVADSRHRTRLINPFGPQRDVYYPFRQRPWNTMTLALRLGDRANVASISSDVRRLVRELDPSLPVYGISTMDENLRDEEARLRITAFLVTCYAVVALLLAALGVYGVLAYLVKRQHREIGIRLALGATPNAVVRLVVRKGMALVVGGFLIGLIIVRLGAELIRGALYGVEPVSWTAHAGAMLGLASVALAACLIPAIRASRIHATTALRAE